MVADGGEKDVVAALEVARMASKLWRELDPEARARPLLKAAFLLEDKSRAATNRLEEVMISERGMTKAFVEREIEALNPNPSPSPHPNPNPDPILRPL